MDRRAEAAPLPGHRTTLGIVHQKIQDASALILVDQVIVSGTSVLSTIIVGRSCGASGLGFFSLALSAIILTRGVQETLVSTPYTVFRLRARDRMSPEEHAGGALAGTLLLAMTLSAIAVVVAVILTMTGRSDTEANLAWVLTIAIPLSLAREFARRFDMATLNASGVLLTDVAASSIQISLLMALAVGGRLTSSTAIFVIGAASGMVAARWCIATREAFSLRRESIAATLAHDWRFGRWLMADQLICFAQLYAMHWLLAAISGTPATGVFAACASIASLASPLLQAAGNYLSPRFAEATSGGSRREIMTLYWRATLTLAVVVTLFALVVSFFSADLLWLLFHDQSYMAYGPVVSILAFRLIFGIPAVAAHHAIVAMERPRRSAAATLCGLVATLLLGVPLISYFGVIGAAVAVFVGTGCECVALLTVFAQCLKHWQWNERQQPG